MLALDLGTKTGWALLRPDGEVVSGTLVLAKAKELREQNGRELDCRYCRLAEFVSSMVKQHSVEVLVFEDVEFSTYTGQTQLWASLRGAVWATGCGIPELEIEAVPVGTLKKFATGHGNATKDMMAAALKRSHPTYFSGHQPDDNEVDAIHLLHYIQKLWNSR
jgi:Holliday junction resolvasome RuvABC endonuclease subunit